MVIDGKIIELLASADKDATADDFKSEIKKYTAAIRLNPAYKERLMDEWDRRGFAGAACGCFNKEIRLDRTDSIAWYCGGFAKHAFTLYVVAIAYFDEAIELNCLYADAWYYRGSAKYHLEDYEDAIMDYDRTICLDPANTAAWIGRGLAKACLKDFDGAIKDVEEASRLSPNNPEIQNYLDTIKAGKPVR